MRVHACVTLLPLLPKSLFSQRMHKKQNKKVNAGVGAVLSCGPRPGVRYLSMLDLRLVVCLVYQNLEEQLRSEKVCSTVLI